MERPGDRTFFRGVPHPHHLGICHLDIVQRIEDDDENEDEEEAFNRFLKHALSVLGWW